jgi:hypothetical protein
MQDPTQPILTTPPHFKFLDAVDSQLGKLPPEIAAPEIEARTLFSSIVIE